MNQYITFKTDIDKEMSTYPSSWDDDGGGGDECAIGKNIKEMSTTDI
jgi:hypothetical protein